MGAAVLLSGAAWFFLGFVSVGEAARNVPADAFIGECFGNDESKVMVACDGGHYFEVFSAVEYPAEMGYPSTAEIALATRSAPRTSPATPARATTPPTSTTRRSTRAGPTGRPGTGASSVCSTTTGCGPSVGSFPAGEPGLSSIVMSNFFDFEMNDINGEAVAFSKFRDQVSLVVNVASK